MRQRKSRSGRRNPFGAVSNPLVQTVLRNLWGTFLVGGGAFVVDMAMDKAFATQTQLQPAVKAGLKIAIGVVGGTALAMAAPGNRIVGDIAAAIGVGGMISGVSDAWAMYELSRLPATTAPASGVAGLYALPGAPAGYVGVDRQACAAGQYR